MAIITTRSGHKILIDDIDLIPLSLFKWHVVKSRPSSPTYAMTRTSKNGTVHHSMMHRIIMKPEEGYQVDHINGDGLDNRRCNLRVCTHSENAKNVKKRFNKTGFTGVYKNGGKWNAMISISGKKKYVGRYETPESAALARDLEAIKVYGEFACLNFPNAGQ